MSGEEETILEFVVRERLTREDVVDLLANLGGQKQGSKDELVERLLAIRGLKAKDAIDKLSTDDLKVVVRRFDIPSPPKPTGLLSFAASVVSDERSSLLRRIEEAASKQRQPLPRSSEQKPNVVPPPKVSPPKRARGGDAPPEPASPPPAPAPPMAVREPDPPRPTATVPPAGSSTGLPAFQETRDFVGSYNFAYQWSEEDYYEAELLGALRGRFGANNAVRQQGDSGRVYDIVVRNSARIEVKLPKQKAELDRMIGQVRRYLSQHPGGVIVVIINHAMRNQQEIQNSRQELESAGAVVFVK